MRVLFTGGRDYTDRAVAWRVMHWLWSQCKPTDFHFTVIVGDCPTGLDKMVRLWTRKQARYYKDNVSDRVKLIIGEADWKGLGRRAGPVRNRWMCERKPKPWLCVAFPGSDGTNGCVKFAKEYEIPVLDLRNIPVPVIDPFKVKLVYPRRKQ